MLAITLHNIPEVGQVAFAAAGDLLAAIAGVTLAMGRVLSRGGRVHSAAAGGYVVSFLRSGLALWSPLRVWAILYQHELYFALCPVFVAGAMIYVVVMSCCPSLSMGVAAGVHLSTYGAMILLL